VNKIPNNQELKMYKVEALAKTGDTIEAQTLIKQIPLANASNPDFWYLKGIIDLYDGESARAKKLFTEGMRLDPDNTKCRLALNKAKKCEHLKEEGNEFIKAGKYEEAC
jgi:DnaJ family protein C protein 7